MSGASRHGYPARDEIIPRAGWRGNADRPIDSLPCRPPLPRRTRLPEVNLPRDLDSCVIMRENDGMNTKGLNSLAPPGLRYDALLHGFTLTPIPAILRATLRDVAAGHNRARTIARRRSISPTAASNRLRVLADRYDVLDQRPKKDGREVVFCVNATGNKVEW